jgi:hypothetical protein
MYKFLHSYHHPEGHPVARILNSYDLESWESLISCWSIPGLEPVIEHFRSEDYTRDEITWGWETKEKHDEWLATAGAQWSSAVVLGQVYSDSVGVSQIHNAPGYDVTPSDGMIATTIDELMLVYSESK